MLSTEDKQAIMQLWDVSQPSSVGKEQRELGRERLESELKALAAKFHTGELEPLVSRRNGFNLNILDGFVLGKNAKFEALSDVLGMMIQKFLERNRPINLMIDVQRFDNGRLLDAPELQLKFKRLR